MSSSLSSPNAATAVHTDPLQPASVSVERESRRTPLPVPHPTQSFWLSPNANPLAKAGSTGPLTSDADICIIGSGITGVSAAYHLTRLLAAQRAVSLPDARPLKIVILEARDFCESLLRTTVILNVHLLHLMSPITGSGATGMFWTAAVQTLALS